MIGSELGRYRILDKLGEGGMGVVYRASDERLARDVALKVLPAGFLSNDDVRKRFHLEARALSRLNHPNIQTVYDFDSQEDVDFLVTEYIPGENVSDILEGGGLPEREVVDLGIQLAEGLSAAHANAVVHRDLKPDNLRVTPEGRLKILDFGLARFLDPGAETKGLQQPLDAGMMLGTLPYMAPEQLRGEPVDARSDVYSAGAVLYELATGLRAFPQRQEDLLMERIESGRVVPVRKLNPSLSAGFERMIGRCLAKAPTARYQSAANLLDDLRRLSADPDAAEPSRRRRNVPLTVAAAGLALVLGAVLARFWDREPPADDGIRTIAVMPLENLSGPDERYFADGMTEMLITDLAHIDALHVISRTSAMRYRETQKTLPEIAAELGADLIVEGTVARDGDRVRVTAQLIDASTDRHLWANSFERDMTDVLSLQSELASAIAGKIEVQLTDHDREALDSVQPVDPPAYDSYLKGRHFLEERASHGFEASIRYFEKAIESDPAHAPAHAELANCYALLSTVGYDLMAPRRAMDLARPYATRALELDDDLAEAHAAVAHIRHNFDWSRDAAEDEYQKAIELNPSYAAAYGWYGFLLAGEGAFDEAVAIQKKALEVDPLSALIHSSIGRTHYYAGQYDEATESLERARECDPRFAPTYALLGMVSLQRDDGEGAEAHFAKGHEMTDGAPVFVAGLGVARERTGTAGAVQAAIDELTKRRADRYVPAFYFAILHNTRGERDAALDWLEQAVEERSGSALYLGVEPLLANLRSEPRLQALIRRVAGEKGTR